MLDTEVLSQVQVALFEPDDAGATFPSGLWQRDEILAYLNERQNRFLKSTLTWVGIADITAVIGQRVYALPQDWLTTVGVVWRGSDGVTRALDRSDNYELDLALPNWRVNAGRPAYYTDEDTPVLTVQVAPAPSIAGTFQLLYIPSAPVLAGDGDPLQVTNEYALPVGKYGTLADAFGKDGRGKNPSKASYAELRYNMAVEMAQLVLKGWQ